MPHASPRAFAVNLCADCGPCCPGLDPNCARSCCPCCPGVTKPEGPEWEAAKADYLPFREELIQIVCKDKASRTCMGCCVDVHSAKRNLDQDWTGRANAALAKHGLQLEVCAFLTYNGQSAQPHLLVQFSKLQEAEGVAAAAPATEASPLKPNK